MMSPPSDTRMVSKRPHWLSWSIMLFSSSLNNVRDENDEIDDCQGNEDAQGSYHLERTANQGRSGQTTKRPATPITTATVNKEKGHAIFTAQGRPDNAGR